MIDRSVAPESAHPNPRDATLDRIETEITRLRAKRPHLEARIDRASNLLVVHLACPRLRVIRIRVAANGQPSFLVTGSHGSVYSVSPSDWSCSCPDHHRRGGICKHGLSCWALMRAAQPAVRLRTCVGCASRLPRRELVEVHENERYFPGDLLCRGCAAQAGVEW